jgi:hypothetical protein
MATVFEGLLSSLEAAGLLLLLDEALEQLVSAA